MFFGAGVRELGGGGVGSDDGGRAFGAQSAPNHWAERGRGRVTGASGALASASDSAAVGLCVPQYGSGEMILQNMERLNQNLLCGCEM